MSSAIDRFPGGTARCPTARNAGRPATIAPAAPSRPSEPGGSGPWSVKAVTMLSRAARPHSPRREPIGRHEKLEDRTGQATGSDPRFVPPVDRAESILVLLIPAKQVHRPESVRSRALDRFVK